MLLSDFMQEKEKKTFANMFDKFAMADRKKEALEKQVFLTFKLLFVQGQLLTLIFR